MPCLVRDWKHQGQRFNKKCLTCTTKSILIEKAGKVLLWYFRVHQTYLNTRWIWQYIMKCGNNSQNMKYCRAWIGTWRQVIIFSYLLLFHYLLPDNAVIHKITYYRLSENTYFLNRFRAIINRAENLQMCHVSLLNLKEKESFGGIPNAFMLPKVKTPFAIFWSKKWIEEGLYIIYTV